MNLYDPSPSEPTLPARRSPYVIQDAPRRNLIARRSRIFFRTLALLFLLAVLFATTVFIGGRFWARKAMHDSLPQIDGTLPVVGLSAPVTVQRDAYGVPHIRAATLDDLIFAQGYVTAQDRLWQMDLLRRHAAGELAEILGPSLVPHDRTQRILQVRAAADRAVASLPHDQLHWLQRYAQGVNASIAAACEERRVFVNAVDDPPNATAYFGGLVRRGPFTIAISSRGEAPALTRLLREVIEGALPPDRWIEEARALRRKWKSHETPMESRFGELVSAILGSRK